MDLRSATLPSTIDIVIKSSAESVAVDTDNSNRVYDYCAYHSPFGLNPLLVVDSKAANSNSMLVLSGERVYTDYQDLYGNNWPIELTIRHQGSQVVDNIIRYHFIERKITISQSTTTSASNNTTTSDSIISTTLDSSSSSKEDSPLMLG